MKDIKESLTGITNFPGKHNIFPKVSALLIIAAIILLILALLNDRNDFTTAMLVAVSLVNFLTGIILISFSAPQGIHPNIAAMLFPSLVIDRAKISSELGVYGDACFIPAEMTGEDITMQFNPVGDFIDFEYDGSYFSTGDEETAGIFSKPSSSSLVNYLRDNNGFKAVSAEESPDTLVEILKEVLTGITLLCEDIEVSDNGEDVVIKIKDPAFIRACSEIRKESPKCCTMIPCPVCSLVCSVTADFYRKVTVVSAIRTDYGKREITIVLEIPSRRPTDAGPGNLH